MKIAFCFDLDGTLTREEILPQVAKRVGLYEEINILTEITMQGLITFDKSLKLRAKLLSTIPVSKVKETISNIKIDESLQDFVQQNKADSFVVTGNLDVWVDDFVSDNYGCRRFTSIAEFNGDNLIQVNKILNKHHAIEEIRNEYDFIIAIGDGMNDCGMFENADIGIAYGGVHKPVSSLVKMSKYVCNDSKALVNLLKSLKRYLNETVVS